MQIGNVNQGRPEWYDRHPNVIGFTYGTTGGIPPAGDVTRWVYTVPSDKKAFIESGYTEIVRVTAAAPNGLNFAALTAAPQFTISNPNMAIVKLWQNVVGANARVATSNIATLLPGDAMLGETRDDSTGGSVDYEIDMLGIEFDF